MCEYFCPNCSAILNDQSGFDADGGIWTCIECGKLLMDDDVYDGDIYDGVAWFCDNCGTLLNRQSEFSDIYDTWTCTECYHMNRISEYDIYQSEEENKKSKGDSCWSNSSSYDDYNVEKDEDDLIEELEYEGLYFEELRHMGLNRRKDAIEGVGLVYDDYEELFSYCTDEDDSKNESDNNVNCFSNSYESTENIYNFNQSSCNEQSQDKQSQKKNERKVFFKRIKAMKFNRKQTKIEKSINDLIGRNVENVKEQLANMGFTNIKAIPILDIYVGSNKSVGEVEQVFINGQSWFDEKNEIPYDAEIIITYHIKRQIAFPFSNKQITGKNYDRIAQQLSSLGFTKIYTNELADLVTGWIKKDGSIQQVSVDEEIKYKKGTVYDYDVKISISYHSFAKKGK